MVQRGPGRSRVPYQVLFDMNGWRYRLASRQEILGDFRILM